jgi:PAS domain S-box-containing protein
MSSSDTNPPARVRILLVDDQPGNLLSLQGVLERDDYELVLAHGGEEALGQVLRNEFAVILLDVAMPGMDGFEVASIIKQREGYRTIPIIFVTASVHHVEWIFRAYDVGAVDFLQKPLDPRQVRAKVAVFVELFRQKRQIAEQAEQLRAKEQRAQAMELERVRFQHERRFRNLAESIPHVVWVAGKDGGIEYVSHRWSEATGGRPEQTAKGSGWLDAVHPDDAEVLRQRWDESIRAGEFFEFEFRLRSEDGALRWYEGRALPERENGSGVVRWLGTFTDIDDQMRAQQDLREAVRIRDEFLSIASHELRTPLTALMLRLQSVRRAIQGQAEPDRLSACLEVAIRQGERLTELINRLLDASRLVSGRLTLQAADVDLVELVREVAGVMADQAARAGCAVLLHLEPEEARGTWDRLRLGQVLTNLLVNAFKYGAGKPVDLTLSADEGTVRIAVTDHGIGMPPEAVDRIFDRFERAVSSTHYGGLGLGLYVVAQVVAAHGGRVSVETRSGEGSTFLVELPRTRTRSEELLAGEERHVG